MSASNDSGHLADGPGTPVQLSVTEIDTANLTRLGKLLLDVFEQEGRTAVEQARGVGFDEVGLN